VAAWAGGWGASGRGGSGLEVFAWPAHAGITASRAAASSNRRAREFLRADAGFHPPAKHPLSMLPFNALCKECALCDCVLPKSYAIQRGKVKREDREETAVPSPGESASSIDDCGTFGVKAIDVASWASETEGGIGKNSPTRGCPI